MCLCKARQNKKAQALLADLAITTVLILTIFSIAINISSYSISLSSYRAKTNSLLSITLQEATLLYNDAAAQKEGSFAEVGTLGKSFNLQKHPILQKSRKQLALPTLNYYTKPPTPDSITKVCTSRKMLGHNSKPAKIWVCAGG